MNIVYVAPFGLGEKTTVWARTLPMAGQAVAAGHRATIVTPPWDTSADSNTRSVRDEVTLIQVDVRGGLPLIWQRMVREVGNLKPDIVHIVKPRAYAGLVQWRLCQSRRMRRGSGPVILLDVDDWEQAWASINHYPPHMARFLTWQEEWGIRHADGITAASRWLVDRAKSYAPQTPRLYLPNGVALADNATEPGTSSVSRYSAANDEQNVLFFTRFVEISPEWLTAFWQFLHSLLPNSRLLVAGNALQDGREDIFRRAIGRAGGDFAASVSWLGHVNSTAIADLYDAADCAIFPAVEEPLQQAKCSVRLATTLLHGVPVVASAVGEQKAYGADGAALLVSAEATPQEFAQAVYAVAGNSEERQALAERARQHLLARYDWDRLGQKLVDFYGKFAAENG